MEDALNFGDIIFSQTENNTAIKNSVFADKVYIVTGASSGIGEAIVRELSRLDANIVLASRNVDKLKEIATAISNREGQCLVIKTDVTILEDCQNLIEQTVLQYGRIDGLINNAGISMRAKFDEVEVDVLKKLMDTNFWGAVYCTKAAFPYLKEAKGTLVAISSIAGITPLPGRTGYAASKHALDGFIETIRTENLNNGLNVLLIHPGFTASGIRKKALNKNGNEQAETPREEEKMMSSKEVAEEVIKAIEFKKRDVILTPEGKLITMIYKNAPALADRLLLNAMHKEDDSPV